MRTRIVIGAGAWLLGAAAATAGGLLVVSELGEGISGSPASQQSSVAAAVQAQASQAAAQPSLSPTPRSQRSTGAQSGTSGAGGSGSTASTSGTVLSSSGGTVVAQCATTGVFLLSWSPQQGFAASSVVRGPATTARVVFTTTASRVTMVVSCASGVPSAATTVTSAPAPTPTGDDGGGGGNPGPGGGGGDT
jgi:hypothetical protein